MTMVAVMWKYYRKAGARHNFFQNALINFISDVAIDLP